MSARQALTVVLGNAATSSANSLIPLLVNGDVFGKDKTVQLILQDDADMECLHGTAMEIQDCCFPHLKVFPCLPAGLGCERGWRGGLWGADLVLLPLPDTPPKSDHFQQLLSLLQPLATALEQSPAPPRVVLVGTEVEVAAYTLHLLAPSLPAHSVVGVVARAGRGMATTAAVARSLAVWWQGPGHTSPSKEDSLPLVVYWGGGLSQDIYYSLPVTVLSPLQLSVQTDVTDCPEWQTTQADRLGYVLTQCTYVKSMLTKKPLPDAVSPFARL